MGQAVDTTGIAGKQAKAITGFQTHTTPVSDRMVVITLRGLMLGIAIMH